MEYYKSTEVLDQQAVKDLTSQWSEYNGAITEKAVDSSKFIYYVKTTDSAGNVSYLASNGATFDTTKPAVTGIADGAVYYVDQVVAVTDTNLDTITLNGNSFASGNKLTGNTDATYAVSATDKAGNNQRRGGARLHHRSHPHAREHRQPLRAHAARNQLPQIGAKHPQNARTHHLNAPHQQGYGG